MPGMKSYKTKDGVYEIPDDKSQAFLKDNPDAKEVSSYTMGTDTFDIPVEESQAFLKDNPTAQPLKKKDDGDGSPSNTPPKGLSGLKPYNAGKTATESVEHFKKINKPFADQKAARIKDIEKRKADREATNKFNDENFHYAEEFKPTVNDLDPIEQKNFNTAGGGIADPDVQQQIVGDIIEQRKSPLQTLVNAGEFIKNDSEALKAAGKPVPDNSDANTYFQTRKESINNDISAAQRNYDILYNNYDKIGDMPDAEKARLQGYKDEVAKNQQYLSTFNKYAKSIYGAQLLANTPPPETKTPEAMNNYYRDIGVKISAIDDKNKSEEKLKNVTEGTDANRDKELVDLENYRYANEGLNAARSAYKAQHESGNMSDADYQSKKSELDEQESKLLDLHPEAKRVAKFQALGQILQQQRVDRDTYKSGNVAIKTTSPMSVFENVVYSGYSDNEIKKAAEEGGFSAEEVKDFINHKDDIPGTSFLGNVYNKFVAKGSDEVVEPLESLATKGRLRTDAEVEKQSNKTAKSFQLANGQSFDQPETIVDTHPKILDENDKSPTYGDFIDNPNYLKDVNNPLAGQHNWGYGALNRVGDATAGLAKLLVITEATGGLGDAVLGGRIGADVIGIANEGNKLKEITQFTAEQKNLFGNVVGMTLTGYDDNKEAAKEFIGEKEGGDAARSMYAITRGLETGLLFGMGFSPQKLVGKVLGAEEKQTAKTFAEMIPKDGGIAAMKPETFATYLKNSMAAKIATSGVSENLKATAMMSLDKVADLATQAMFSPQSVQDKNVGHDLLNDGIQNFITFAPISFLGAGVHTLNNRHEDQGKLEQEAIYRMGKDPISYQNYVNKEVKKGNLKQDDANARIKVVNEMAKIQNDGNVPQNLSRGEKIEFANNLLHAKYLKEEIDKIDPLNKTVINKKNAQLQELEKRRDEIVEKSTGTEKDGDGKPIVNPAPVYKIAGKEVTKTEFESALKDPDAKNILSDAEVAGDDYTQGELRALGNTKDEPAEIKPTVSEKVDAVIPKETMDAVSGTLDKIGRSEPINEKEIGEAENHLYSALDAAPEAAHLIESLILKLQDYEHTTKTETRTVTEKEPTGTTTKIKREIKPALEQSEGSEATVTLPDGGVRKGKLAIKGGQYVLDIPNAPQIVIGEKAITDRDLKLPDEKRVPNPVGFDEHGNVASVTFEAKNGNLVTIHDPEKALDMAIQLHIDAVGEIPDAAFDEVYREVEKQVQVEVLAKDISSQKSENEKEKTGKETDAQKGNVNESGAAQNPVPDFTGLSHIQSAGELLKLGAIDEPAHTELVKDLTGTDDTKKESAAEKIKTLKDEAINTATKIEKPLPENEAEPEGSGDKATVRKGAESVDKGAAETAATILASDNKGAVSSSEGFNPGIIQRPNVIENAEAADKWVEGNIKNETSETLLKRLNELEDLINNDKRISDNDKKYSLEAIQRAKEKSDKGAVDMDNAKAELEKAKEDKKLGVYGYMKPEDAIKQIAAQAQNISEDGTEHKPEDASAVRKSTENQFGKELVDAAIKVHPKENLLNESKGVNISKPTEKGSDATGGVEKDSGGTGKEPPKEETEPIDEDNPLEVSLQRDALMDQVKEAFYKPSDGGNSISDNTVFEGAVNTLAREAKKENKSVKNHLKDKVDYWYNRLFDEDGNRLKDANGRDRQFPLTDEQQAMLAIHLLDLKKDIRDQQYNPASIIDGAELDKLERQQLKAHNIAAVGSETGGRALRFFGQVYRMNNDAEIELARKYSAQAFGDEIPLEQGKFDEFAKGLTVKQRKSAEYIRSALQKYKEKIDASNEAWNKSGALSDEEFEKEVHRQVQEHISGAIAAAKKDWIEESKKASSEKKTTDSKGRVVKEKANSIADKMNDFADKLGGKGITMSSVVGLAQITAKWIIKGIAEGIRQGGKIPELIEKFVGQAKLKDEYDGFDEAEVRDQIKSALSNVGIDEKIADAKPQSETAIEKIKEYAKNSSEKGITKEAISKGVVKDLFHSLGEQGVPVDKISERASELLKENGIDTDAKDLNEAYLGRGKHQLNKRKDIETEIQKTKREISEHEKLQHDISELDKKIKEVEDNGILSRPKKYEKIQSLNADKKRKLDQFKKTLRDKGIKLETGSKYSREQKESVIDSHNQAAEKLGNKITKLLDDATNGKNDGIAKLSEGTKNFLRDIKRKLTHTVNAHSLDSQMDQINANVRRELNDFEDKHFTVDKRANKDLAGIREDLTHMINDLAKNREKAAEEIKLSDYKKRLESEKAEYERKLAAGEWDDTHLKVDVKKDADAYQAQIEKDKAKFEFYRAQKAALDDLQPGWIKALKGVRELTRNMLLSGLVGIQAKLAGSALTRQFQPVSKAIGRLVVGKGLGIESFRTKTGAATEWRALKETVLGKTEKQGQDILEKSGDKLEATLDAKNKSEEKYRELVKEHGAESKEATQYKMNELQKATTDYDAAALEHSVNDMYNHITPLNKGGRWIILKEGITREEQEQGMLGKKETLRDYLKTDFEKLSDEDATKEYKKGLKALTPGLKKAAKAAIFYSKWIVRSHGVWKDIPARHELVKGYINRLKNAQANGEDISDFRVKSRLWSETVGWDMQEAKFQDKNKAVDVVRKTQGLLSGEGWLKDGNAKTALKTIVESATPVLKVPVNIYHAALQYNLGVLTGSIRILHAMYKAHGMDMPLKEFAETHMTEQQKYNIQTAIGRGSVGLAGMIWAYYATKNGSMVMGGNYPDPKRKTKLADGSEVELDYGDIVINGHMIPHVIARALEHLPVFFPAVVGSDAAATNIQNIGKKDPDHLVDAWLSAGTKAALDAPVISSFVERGLNKYGDETVEGKNPWAYLGYNGAVKDIEKVSGAEQRAPDYLLNSRERFFNKSGLIFWVPTKAEAIERKEAQENLMKDAAKEIKKDHPELFKEKKDPTKVDIQAIEKKAHDKARKALSQ